MSHAVFWRVLPIPPLALLAALPVFPAWAGDAADPPQVAVPEMLVTATRLPEAKEAVGSPVTQISGEGIHQHQARSLSDALEDTPGVTVMRSGGVGQNTSLFIRGADSDHTLLLMDGVRMMDPASPNNLAAFDHLMAGDLERLEVLPGAQSPLHGSGAIGGVVAGTTPRGQGPTNGAASVEGGSRNSWTERVHAGGGDDRFNWYAGAARMDTRGFSATHPDRERDAYGNTSGAVRLGWGLTEVLSLDLIARGAQAGSDYDAGGDFRFSHTDAQLGFVKLTPKVVLFDGKWEQTLNLSTFNTVRENQGVGAFSGFPSRFKGRNLELDWQNTLHASKTLDLVGGVDLLRQDAKGSGAFSTYEADAQTYAAYGQARWNPVERVTLNGGARVDKHSDFGTHATWRGAAAYDLVETNTTWRASVGTGFKAPALAELHDATFGSNNPNLKPERSLGWDAGFDQRFFGEKGKAKLVLSGTCFENRITDLIQSDPATFVNQNLDKARTRGVESAVTWQPMQGDAAGTLKITGSYTYTDTQAEGIPAGFGLTPGSRLLRRPLHQAALRADYTLPHEAASVGVVGRYLGVRSDLDPVTFATVQADDKLVWDVVARVKITSQVSFFGRLENLFDNGTPEVLGFNPTPFGAFAGVEVKF